MRIQNCFSPHPLPLLAICLTATTLLFFSGCSKGASAKTPPPPPDVEVADVEKADVPIFREWIGTLEGMVNASIQAQATGYVVRQNYMEGSLVRKGQSLFEIDARSLQAALDQSLGELAKAMGQLGQAQAGVTQAIAQYSQAAANQKKAQLDENRYIPLAKQQAITQQDLDNALQSNLSAKAAVESASAGIETAKAQVEAANASVQAAEALVKAARVNRGFTQLISPIDGIAGKAMVQVGNLVGPATGTITTVSTVDPIKVVFSVGEQDYLSFSRRGPAQLAELQFELILSDGSIHPAKGHFLFADREVNQNTGAILLTGTFPNPQNMLRPGQYAKVRAAIEEHKGALLVPQRAVSELQGTYQVSVVDSQGKVIFRPVVPGNRVGSKWIITKGITQGERVITDGMKVGPGMQVNAKPAADKTKQGDR